MVEMVDEFLTDHLKYKNENALNSCLMERTNLIEVIFNKLPKFIIGMQIHNWNDQGYLISRKLFL